MIKKIIVNGLKTSFALALTTTAAVMVASNREQGSPWSAINCVAHIVDGDEVEQPNEFSPRESSMGIAVNAAAMVSWGVLYEGVLAVTKVRSNPITAIIGTVITYVTDYKIVPKRLTPGIEKKLSQNAIWAIYAVLGTTLALSGFWNQDGDAEAS